MSVEARFECADCLAAWWGPVGGGCWCCGQKGLAGSTLMSMQNPATWRAADADMDAPPVPVLL